MMTSRERFVRSLTGQPVDRVPFIKLFGGTNAAHPEWEREHPGIGAEIDRLLQFEGTYRGWAVPPVNLDSSFSGPPRVIESTETTVKRVRGDGTVEMLYRGGGDYNRHTIEWPVRNRRDWANYKARHLQADDPARFPPDWPDWVEKYRTREYPLQLTHRGVYGFPRERMGDENLGYAFYDDPALVHDIMDSYTDMALQVWETMCRDVEFDLIECWEDMASKNGSIISPAHFREFMAPNYRRIAEFAKRHRIPVILVDSDGNTEALTGLMLEAGVTAMYPYEVLAGNDVERVRRTYPSFGILGGLRKEAMIEGKAAIDREMEKARRYIRLGRCIPGPDHFVLKVVPFANYRYFMERLRDVVLTTTPGN